ncbi:MAG: hypothetical protein ACE5G8_15625, partial [Anaerolineae bacterium]
MPATRLALALLLAVVALAGGALAIGLAQDCPGKEVYVNTTTGDDDTGDGKTDDTAFKTVNRAVRATKTCTTAVTIFLNNAPYRQIPVSQPEPSGCVAGLGLMLLGGGTFAARRR